MIEKYNNTVLQSTEHLLIVHERHTVRLSGFPSPSSLRHSHDFGHKNVTVIIYKYEKHFPKMYRDVGMAVPKTTETRCRDGSVQARQDIKRLHKQPHPYIFLFT